MRRLLLIIVVIALAAVVLSDVCSDLCLQSSNKAIWPIRLNYAVNRRQRAPPSSMTGARIASRSTKW
jgi:hypothetical protein